MKRIKRQYRNVSPFNQHIMNSTCPNSSHHRTFTTRTYADALHKLNSLTSNRQTTSLFENTKRAAANGNPNALAIPEMLTFLSKAGLSPKALSRLRHIHIAGTKGKGSVSAFATSILKQYPDQAGPIGTYTSPHLVSPRERIAINGEAICEEEFAEGFFELWDKFGQAPPFYFRYLTILAWHVFLKRNVQSVVLECGIGGEYDATNVVPPEAVSATVVTQLGIDHVAMLGSTREEIAWHKAGIFKKGVKGFTRRIPGRETVMEVLRRRSEEKGGAGLVEVEDEVVERWGGVEDGYLKGDFQKYNQALAVMAVREHLGMEGDVETSLMKMPEEMVVGLRDAKLRGRCEVVEREKETWLLDGAHTKDSLEEVGKWAAQNLQPDGKMILVFNQQERDAEMLLANLLDALRRATGREDFLAHAIFTRNELQPPEDGEDRDMSVQEKCAASMKSSTSQHGVQTFNNLNDAVAEATRVSRELGTTKILTTGSLHLVGGVLQVLEP